VETGGNLDSPPSCVVRLFTALGVEYAVLESRVLKVSQTLVQKLPVIFRSMSERIFMGML